MSSSFLFPRKGNCSSLNTPNCSFIGDGFGSNDLEIGLDSPLFQDPVPSFDMLMHSDAAFADAPNFMTPSSLLLRHSDHSPPGEHLYDQAANSFSPESGIQLLNNSDTHPVSESAAIDLSFLCHDLGIKGTEVAGNGRGWSGRVDRRPGSQTKSKNEDRKAWTREEMMSAIESQKKKGRYWYDKFKSSETARDSLNRRLRRYQLQESNTEFQTISKIMKDWELAFKKSRDHMMHSVRCVERAFDLLKESVMQKHLSRSVSESTLAYEGRESAEHNQESNKTRKEHRVLASADIRGSVTPSRGDMMDHAAGGTGTSRQRPSLPTTSAAKNQMVQPTQSFSELLALASPHTAISRLNETPSRPSGGGSKSARKPLTKLALAKEQNSLSRKYLQVTKEKREAMSRTPVMNKKKEEMKSCPSRGRKNESGSSNKSQKDVKRMTTPSR